MASGPKQDLLFLNWNPILTLLMKNDILMKKWNMLKKGKGILAKSFAFTVVN